MMSEAIVQHRDGVVTCNSYTDQQERFIDSIVNGSCQTDAARMAEYAFPAQAAHYLVRQSHIQAEIRRRLERRLITEAAPLALNALISVASNERVSPAARVSAANSLMDRSGIVAAVAAKAPPSDKPIADMGLPELDAFISAGIEALERRRRSIDAEEAQIIGASPGIEG